MREKLTILVVGGHPADVFDHCGGTMAHHIQQGDNVVLTAGVPLGVAGNTNMTRVIEVW